MGISWSNCRLKRGPFSLASMTWIQDTMIWLWSEILKFIIISSRKSRACLVLFRMWLILSLGLSFWTNGAAFWYHFTIEANCKHIPRCDLRFWFESLWPLITASVMILSSDSGIQYSSDESLLASQQVKQTWFVFLTRSYSHYGLKDLKEFPTFHVNLSSNHSIHMRPDTLHMATNHQAKATTLHPHMIYTFQNLELSLCRDLKKKKKSEILHLRK